MPTMRRQIFLAQLTGNIKKQPDSSSHPGKGQYFAAASSGFWLPIPSLSGSSGYCRGLYCAGPLQSDHGPYKEIQRQIWHTLLSSHLNGETVLQMKGITGMETNGVLLSWCLGKTFTKLRPLEETLLENMFFNHFDVAVEMTGDWWEMEAPPASLN